MESISSIIHEKRKNLGSLKRNWPMPLALVSMEIDKLDHGKMVNIALQKII